MNKLILSFSVLSTFCLATNVFAYQTSMAPNPLASPSSTGVTSVIQPSAPGQYPGYVTPSTPISENPYTAPQAPTATQSYQQPINAPQNPSQQMPGQQVYQQNYTTATGISTPPQATPSNLPPLPSDFDLGVQQNLSMTPKEIRELHSLLDARQKAAADLPHPPKSVTGSISLSLDPGSSPGIVRPFFGVSTSLVVLDSTGAPWPVENFSVCNQTLFAVHRLDGPAGSSFVIDALQMYGQSNLILKLVGAPTPVVINLISGQKVFDARVEARVLGHGPNAQISSTSLTPGVDSRLISVLDGVPPSGHTLTIAGDNTSKAWIMPNGHVWLRTRLTVISPAPISFVSASDGTRVYELTANARILGMLNGEFVTLDLSGCLQECASVDDSNSKSW